MKALELTQICSHFLAPTQGSLEEGVGSDILSSSGITYVTVTILAKINGGEYVRPTDGTQKAL